MSDARDRSGAAHGAAVITGAATGIGLAVAARLAHDGWWIAALDQDRAGAEAAGQEVGGIGVEVDVTDSASVERAFGEVRERLGPIAALVCNAGIAGPAKPIQDQTDEDWLSVIAVDLTGVFLCCRAVVPEMIEAGWGRIVNVSSVAGKEGNPNMVAYSAAKAGVLGLTKSIGKELAQKGVLVNAITPAVVRTRILDQLTQDQIDYMISRIPMGRTAEAAEIAAAVAWLVSEDASFTTAAALDLSGGRTTY
jgi:3-oxoacyl-[acyl-carrier protein] reductase